MSTEPDTGFKFTNHVIMARAEIKSCWMDIQPTEPRRHPVFTEFSYDAGEYGIICGSLGGELMSFEILQEVGDWQLF